MTIINNLNKIILLVLFLTIVSIHSIGQQNQKPYDPKIDANKQISKALKKAKKENKHVLLQVGGNWCSWCILLHKFYNDEEKVDSILNKEYVLEYINFSKENKNLSALQKLEFPQRFGFPVLVILDAEGKRLHTQNSAYLEECRGYSLKKVIGFLNNWKPDALNPKNYQK